MLLWKERLNYDYITGSVSGTYEEDISHFSQIWHLSQETRSKVPKLSSLPIGTVSS